MLIPFKESASHYESMVHVTQAVIAKIFRYLTVAGKSKVLSGGFCLRDSEAERRELQFLHIYCSNVNSCS